MGEAKRRQKEIYAGNYKGENYRQNQGESLMRLMRSTWRWFKVARKREKNHRDKDLS